MLVEKQKQKELKKQKEKDEIEKQREIQKEKRIQRLIKKYGQKNGLLIYERRVWIGMTKEMAIDSWGEPEDINKTIYTFGVHEQWIYLNNYLYFEDGILKVIQD